MFGGIGFLGEPTMVVWSILLRDAYLCHVTEQQ